MRPRLWCTHPCEFGPRVSPMHSPSPPLCTVLPMPQARPTNMAPHSFLLRFAPLCKIRPNSCASHEAILMAPKACDKMSACASSFATCCKKASDVGCSLTCWFKRISYKEYSWSFSCTRPDGAPESKDHWKMHKKEHYLKVHSKMYSKHWERSVAPPEGVVTAVEEVFLEIGRWDRKYQILLVKFPNSLVGMYDGLAVKSEPLMELHWH